MSVQFQCRQTSQVYKHDLTQHETRFLLFNKNRLLSRYKTPIKTFIKILSQSKKFTQLFSKDDLIIDSPQLILIWYHDQ